ncbi:hypothetical protein HMPREF2829_07000 [Aerococcus sp. HMSC072A12]|nr:hypothetical protein HMPREF2829_07000 [Aerococcus sp. HMSC072A12]OFR34827.1 hypothetical protein HMPREF2892_02135 [Aerococcus sp. HMSC061A03]OFT43302.1 hypothetical protein HMPREF3161_01255 [Aerococcus sp. HMSC06H08]
MLAFYDRSEGEIYFGDYSIDDLSLKQLRHRISYVPQNAFILTGSVYDNLVFGLDKKVTKEEIYYVLRTVQLWESIKDAPQGLHTFIEENGTNLSGGQKQRLALARALLRQSDIYILDEATSALNPEMEKEIINDLMTREETFIFIGHHLPNINQCDQRIVLSNNTV